MFMTELCLAKKFRWKKWRTKPLSKIKQVLQHDETDCGAACLSIILQY